MLRRRASGSKESPSSRRADSRRKSPSDVTRIADHAKAEELLEKLVSFGFDPITRPDHEEFVSMARLNNNVATMTSSELGTFMAHVGAWREYTESLLMEATMDYAFKKEDYDSLYNERKLEALNSKKSGKTKEHALLEVECEEDVNELWNILLQAEQMKEVLTSKLSSYNNLYTLISREIARRESA